MNDIFVDSFNAGVDGGSIAVTNLINGRLRNSLVRTSELGTAVLIDFDGGLAGNNQCNLLIEGCTVELPDGGTNGVVLREYCNALLKHSQVDSVVLDGQESFLRRWERDALYQLPYLGDLASLGTLPNAPVQNPNGDIYIRDTGHEGGPSLKGLEFAAPDQTPYNVTLCMAPGLSSKQNVKGGIYWRDSASGKLIVLQFVNGVLAYSKFDSPTSFNADYVSIPYSPGGDVWFRLRRDDTTMFAQYSPDGLNYSVLHATATGDFMTPDSVGFFVDAENIATPDVDAQILVKHFTSESDS